MPARINTAAFVERARARHGDRYDYSATLYQKSCVKVEIRCREHGIFQQEPRHHASGRGCPQCKADATRRRCAHDLDGFVRAAKAVHGDRYDYSATLYQKSCVKVEIRCREHGPFQQTPNNHVSKKTGCPKCAGKLSSTEDFVLEATDRHGDRYAYDRAIYAGAKKKITITCAAHGDFQQAAEAHLLGHGCVRCWQESYTSNAERELAEWISSLGIAVSRNDRSVLDGQEIDIHLPTLGIGIEYNGCYWHSDRVQKNHAQHAFKLEAARRAGIRLVAVWDYQWIKNRSVVERYLLHAFGLDPREPVHARKCRIAEIANSDARSFYENHHLQGACPPGMATFGLTDRDKLVACMTFARGAARRGMMEGNEWELARYATSAPVRGGASRLFHHLLARCEPARVWSYSDDQHFTGDMYRALGFRKDGTIASDYRVVHPGTLRVWHKSQWQRKHIPTRLRELGLAIAYDPATDPRTEWQMEDAARVLRVWDAGKTRWLFQP